MKSKLVVSVLSMFTASALLLTGCGTKSTTSTNESKKVDYPAKPITLVNYIPQGAGPDVVARKVAELMEKQSGFKFNIINVPGGQSGDALKQVWAAPHDGYTMLGQSENMLGLSIYGLAEQTAKDWTFFETSQEVAVIAVKADSPYKKLSDLIEAAKQRPGQIKMGNGGTGRSFHLKAKILERVAGVQFQDVEYFGGVNIGDKLMAKEIDAASISEPQIDSLIRDGKLRVLVTTDSSTLDFGGTYGRVESITKYYPEARKYLPIDAVQGFAMPADVPDEIREAFGSAFAKAVNSDEMQEFLEKRKAIKVNLWGEGAKKYMANMESNFTWFAKELGLTKVDPEALGIPKP